MLRKFSLVSILTVLFFCLFLSACAGKNEVTKVLPERTALSLSLQNSEYKLQPTDVLKISVHEQPDLDTTTRVTTKGYIAFPLIGEVKAAGITVRDLQAEIKRLLEKDYLTTAQVNVFIEEYHERKVSVIGEVKNPGSYSMPAERSATLLEVISLAGGFTKDADENGTRIIRVQDGQTKTIAITVSDIKKGKKQDIVIEPEDVVAVPESFF